jgi:hypothetical protein
VTEPVRGAKKEGFKGTEFDRLFFFFFFFFFAQQQTNKTITVLVIVRVRFFSVDVFVVSSPKGFAKGVGKGALGLVVKPVITSSSTLC